MSEGLNIVETVFQVSSPKNPQNGHLSPQLKKTLQVQLIAV